MGTQDHRRRVGAADLWHELASCWRQHPNRVLFVSLAAAWVALFHFVGNATLGYTKTASLFGWLRSAYRGDPDSAHSYFIPLIVAFFMITKRRELAALPKGLWWPALVLVVLSLGIHTAGYLIQFSQVSVVAFFLGLYGLTGLVWGWPWLRATFFPMVLFAFAIPLGSLAEPITFPLRMVATKITVFLCNGILDLQVIREGTLVSDPTGRFHYEVSAACGGIRSLIAMAALTTIYGFVQFRSHWRRALTVASAVPLAVLGNIVRLFSIIVAAAAFGQGAGAFVHDRLGLLPYIPAIAGMLVIGHLLRERRPPDTVRVNPAPA